MLLEAFWPRARLAGAHHKQRPASDRHSAARRPPGNDSRGPRSCFDLSVARLGQLLGRWSVFRAILAAGLRHVRQTPREWDYLELRWVQLGLRRPWGNASIDERCRLPALRTEVGPHLACRTAGSVAELLWNGRETKFRKNIDRLDSRMHEAGKVEYVPLHPRINAPAAAPAGISMTPASL